MQQMRISVKQKCFQFVLESVQRGVRRLQIVWQTVPYSWSMKLRLLLKCHCCWHLTTFELAVVFSFCCDTLLYVLRLSHWGPTLWYVERNCMICLSVFWCHGTLVGLGHVIPIKSCMTVMLSVILTNVGWPLPGRLSAVLWASIFMINMVMLESTASRKKQWSFTCFLWEKDFAQIKFTLRCIQYIPTDAGPPCSGGGAYGLRGSCRFRF